MNGVALVTAILNVAEATLSLLGEREKNYATKKAFEIAERLHQIKSEWYKEYNRDPETRSDAVLDSLELELRNCLSDFAVVLRSANVPDSKDS
jgi:hypothetical protein